MYDGIDTAKKLDVRFLVVGQELAADPKGGRAHPNDLGGRDVDFLQRLPDLGVLLTADAEIAKHLAVQCFDYFGCHGCLCMQFGDTFASERGMPIHVDLLTYWRHWSWSSAADLARACLRLEGGISKC